MKNGFRKYGVLLILICLGIAAALVTVLTRIQVEEANKTYDIVMDYSSLNEMVKASDEDMEFWLEYFRELGLEKLAVQEETINSLVTEYKGQIRAQTPAAIYGNYGWRSVYPEKVHDVILNSKYPDDVLVSCEDPELFAWILHAFQTRTTENLWVYYHESGTAFLFLAGDGKDVTGASLISMPLGVDPQKQALAEKYGYTLIPRTLPVEGLNGNAFAQAVLADYEDLSVPYIIGGGDGILGYDDPETAYPLLLEYLQSHDVTLGMVETSAQSKNLVGDGLEELVLQSGYDALRVFSMWDYVQWRFGWYNYDGPQEITNCLYRAAYERNCRLIYLKMMMSEQDDGTCEYVTDPEEYGVLLGDFMERMEQRGFTMQTLTAAEEISVSFLSLVLMAIGAVAAAVLLLALVFSLRGKWVAILAVLGCVAAAGVLYVMPNTGRLILSIGGGIVMPLLAIVILHAALRKTDGKMLRGVECIFAILAVAVISLAGGLFAAAPLSDSAYMLEMELYRGVKVMQLIPLAGFVLYMLWCWLEGTCRKLAGMPDFERKAAVQRVMDIPIKVKTLVWVVAAAIVVAIVAAVGSYYLARTGHTDAVGVADLELQVRNFLELHLTARPRTKEFLIGYPCVMLFVWSCRKSEHIMELFSLCFGLGAVIGATSIVNTFLHIRTAFMLSLVRVVTGLAAGLVMGLVAIALAEVIYRLLKKRLCHG